MIENVISELRRLIHDDLIDKSCDGWSGDAFAISVEDAADAVMRVVTPVLEQSQREVERLRTLLKPFVAVLDVDIGESEADDDIFQPMQSQYNRAPKLTIGHFRAIRQALEEEDWER